MAKLITKFKYLKPNARESVGGYAKYIATREGVEKIDESYKLAPSSVKQQQLIKQILKDFPDSKEMLEYEDYLKEPNVGKASEFITRALEDNAYEVMQTKTYADYIATRPRVQRFGTHGLFTDDGIQVKLNEVSDELNHHDGNVWTVIISLRREDAERLGFNNGERWRDMLRTQTEAIAKNFKIPMTDLKWYAAFHNESHHPHVHMMVYTSEEQKPYLSRKGIMNLRSSLAKDIFAQDMLCIYEKQTRHRDLLRSNSRELIAEIVGKINSGVYDNPKLEELLKQLADRLSKTSGKKQYGYLKADVKAIVNRIIDELSKDERIGSLYKLWYEQREEVLKIYTDELPKRLPLVENEEFRPIKNAVIREAMNILENNILFDEDIDDTVEEILHDTDESDMNYHSENEPIEPNPIHSDNRRTKDTWWTDEYKMARLFFYGTKEQTPDFEKAFSMMQTEAAKGNGFAMHDLAKMYLSGLGCDKDETKAQEWFGKTYDAFIKAELTVKKKDYLQYRIGKLFSFGYGVEQDYTQAASWYRKAVSVGNPFAAYSLGSLYHRGQGVIKDDEKAYELYRMAAEHPKTPNAYAAYELGRMCKNGIGTDPNELASEKWYSIAYKGFIEIEKSMADDKLYYRLGQMNLNGVGTEMDIRQAKTYFEKSAKLENLDALYALGKLYLCRDTDDYSPDKALEYLLQAAKRGHEYAQYTLGKLFLKGDIVPKNIAYALRWLEEAVDKGNQYAEYLLGKTLLFGEDAEQDLPRAEDLLKHSSEQGNRYAKYLLGKAYIEGDLLLQNISEGIKLLTESADSGYASAQYLLGKLLYRGEVIPQNLEMAIEYLEQAAEGNHSYAAYLAGKILLTEESVKDILRAIKNLEIAAENGNDFTEYQLGKLYLYGKEVEQDYGKAIAYLTSAAEHGNQYAQQLLHSIRNNKNWSAAMGSFRLLQHLARLLQNRMEDERRDKSAVVDRKLKRKIEDKKKAHGIKQ